MSETTNSTLQEWVMRQTRMQQSVLMSAVRGPDGLRKHHQCKALLRWYRRCVFISAFEGAAILNPFSEGGGSFTGPSMKPPPWDKWEEYITPVVDAFLDSRDELPAHYYLHFMHAVEIVGYKHDTMRIQLFWNAVYVRMVRAMHLHTETEGELDDRLGDDEKQWRSYSDPSSTCSD